MSVVDLPGLSPHWLSSSIYSAIILMRFKMILAKILPAIDSRIHLWNFVQYRPHVSWNCISSRCFAVSSGIQCFLQLKVTDEYWELIPDFSWLNHVGNMWVCCTLLLYAFRFSTSSHWISFSFSWNQSEDLLLRWPIFSCRVGSLFQPLLEFVYVRTVHYVCIQGIRWYGGRSILLFYVSELAHV